MFNTLKNLYYDLKIWFMNTEGKGYKNIKKVGLAIICFAGTEHLYNIISAIKDSVDYVSIGL